MKEIEFDWPILGQKRIKNFLRKSLINESFTHAYLFIGANNIGKTLTAKLLAKSFLCENYKKYQENSIDSKVNVPCNQCQHCQQFEKGIHPDVNFLEREKKEDSDELRTQISVKQVRELQSRISKRAFLNSYKIVIAPQADFLTDEAANSLLKTLEEPSQKTVIILVAQNKKNLLQTIVSRCQVLSFLTVSKEEIYDYLLDQQANRNQAKQFSALAQGRPTRAMKLFANTDDFNELQKTQIDFLNVLSKNTVEKFNFADSEAENSRDELTKRINEWSILLRDLLLLKIGADKQVANKHLSENFTHVRDSFSEQKIMQLLKILEQTKSDIKNNINIKITLENFFLKV